MNPKSAEDKGSLLLTIIGAIVALLVGVWLLKRVVSAVFWLIQLGVIALIIGGVIWFVLRVANKKQ